MNNLNKNKQIYLVSDTDTKYPISTNDISISQLVMDIIEDSEDDIDLIPLNISDECIKKIIEFCEHYNIDPLFTDENMSLTNGEMISTPDIRYYIPEWYSNYVNIDINILFLLLKSSDFLHIDPLIELCCLKIGTLIKDRSTEELRTIFNIYDDVSFEEKEEFVQAHAWININS
jgi:S-phase kinase-associated protein 1